MAKRTQPDAREIVYRDLDQLIPHPANARTHSDEQIAQIVASIREFGWTNPILVDESLTILAGHGRRLAAKRLELQKVPTVTLSGLTPAQVRAYILADNKIALNAGWDAGLLLTELVQLRAEKVELSLTGFEEIELREILRTSGPQKKRDGKTKMRVEVECPHCGKSFARP